MPTRTTIESLVHQVLDGTVLSLKVDAYAMEDNLETGEVNVRCEVHDGKTGEKKTIIGTGVGLVDAFFHGIVNMYSDNFPSLNTIQFSDFSIKANLETGRDSARSDSEAAVVLKVSNADGHTFEFSQASPSLTRASIQTVLAAASFFINCERAFIEVYRALEHAREQKRPDSISTYTQHLTTLVEATSYSDVIEQIREREALKSTKASQDA